MLKTTLALGLLLGAVGVTQAALITKSDSFSPVLQVDGSSSSTTLDILAADVPVSTVITDVDVVIDFTKCDNPISGAGACNGGGFSFNSEIVLRLTGPSGTTVNLVDPGSYSGSTPGAQIVVTFDDAALATVGGPTLLSGDFSPVGLLSDFNGEDPVGTWTLFFQDTVGADPLSLNAWELRVTTRDDGPTVPTPAPLALLGLGLLVLGQRRLANAKR